MRGPLGVQDSDRYCTREKKADAMDMSLKHVTEEIGLFYWILRLLAVWSLVHFLVSLRSLVHASRTTLPAASLRSKLRIVIALLSFSAILFSLNMWAHVRERSYTLANTRGGDAVWAESFVREDLHRRIRTGMIPLLVYSGSALVLARSLRRLRDA